MAETGRCRSITKGGGPCRGIAKAGSDVCYAHEPDRVEGRRRNASRGGQRGGRGRPGSGRLAAVDRSLTEMISGVLDGSVDRGDAAVVIQAANARIRLTGAELQVREREELLERIARLEEQIAKAALDREEGHGDEYGGGGGW